MGNFIGLVPVPGDKPLGEFIESLIDRDSKFLRDKINELNKTIEETEESEQPHSFAYAKLMNYLAKVMSQSDLVALCAASMWAIASLEGESNGSDGPA